MKKSKKIKICAKCQGVEKKGLKIVHYAQNNHVILYEYHNRTCLEMGK